MIPFSENQIYFNVFLIQKAIEHITKKYKNG